MMALLKARQACNALELCDPKSRIKASPKLDEFEALVSEIASARAGQGARLFGVGADAEAGGDPGASSHPRHGRPAGVARRPRCGRAAGRAPGGASGAEADAALARFEGRGPLRLSALAAMSGT